MNEETKAGGEAKNAHFNKLVDDLRASAAQMNQGDPEALRLRLRHQSWMLDQIFGHVLEHSTSKSGWLREESLRLALQSQRQFRQAVWTLDHLKKSSQQLMDEEIVHDTYLSPDELDYFTAHAHKLHEE